MCVCGCNKFTFQKPNTLASTRTITGLITFELELKILCYIQKINKIPKTENKKQHQ